jgi:hypothetical protein
MQYEVNLIFYGENVAEYGNNIEDNFRPTMDPKYFETEGDISQIALGGVPVENLISEMNLTMNFLGHLKDTI